MCSDLCPCPLAYFNQINEQSDDTLRTKYGRTLHPTPAEKIIASEPKTAYEPSTIVPIVFATGSDQSYETFLDCFESVQADRLEELTSEFGD